MEVRRNGSSRLRYQPTKRPLGAVPEVPDRVGLAGTSEDQHAVTTPVPTPCPGMRATVRARRKGERRLLGNVCREQPRRVVDHDDGDACHGVPRQTSRCTMTSPGSQPIGRRLVAPARGTLASDERDARARSRGGESDAGGAPELSIVVTLFQERATLEELHGRLTAALDAFGRLYEVIYVDDGSTDGTFAVLERIHDGDARVRAVRLKRNSASTRRCTRGSPARAARSS